MTCDEPCTPLVNNDDCAGAIAIAPQLLGTCVPLQSTNVCAGTSVQPNPPCDQFAPINDVWFSFNSGPSAIHTITVEPDTAGPMLVAVYSVCDTLVYVVCQSTDSLVQLTGLQLNTVYYIRVWNGGGDAAGTFTICDQAPIIDGIGGVSAEQGLRVWPVPAKDALNVDGLPPGIRTLRLVDTQGRTVIAQQTNGALHQRMNIGGLVPGTYLLRAEGEEIRVLRVVIE